MDRYDQHGGVVHRSLPEDAATCAAVMPVSETWPIPLAPSSDISSLATSFRDLTIARWRVVNPAYFGTTTGMLGQSWQI